MSVTGVDRSEAPARSEADRFRLGDPLADLAALAGTPGAVQVALESIRAMLGMDVAYVTEIIGDNMLLRAVEGDGASFGLAPERSLPLEQTYCKQMLEGRLPNMVPDVREDRGAASLPITTRANVRAVATVPLAFADGTVYGTLCAASHEVKTFDRRDLQFLNVFARLIADQLELQQTAAALTEVAALVNAADDAIIGLTCDGLVSSWNSASERIFGYPASQAIGRNIVDLIAPAADEGEAMLRALATVAGGEVVHREGLRRRADGSMVYDAVTLSPIRDANGEVSLISAVSRDISAAARRAHYRGIEQEVVSALQSATDPAQAIEATLRGLGRGLDCEIAVLWEPDPDRQAWLCRAVWTSDRSAAAPFARRMHETRLGWDDELPGRVQSSGAAVWIHPLGRFGASSRMSAAADAGLQTAVAAPLRSGGEIVGVVEFFSANATPEDPDLLALGQGLVGRLSDALERYRAQRAVREANEDLERRVRERTKDLQRAVTELDALQVETVQRLSRAVDFRDHDTGAHTMRISRLAARLAQSAGLDAERCALIERASPLHDVGKVAIPDAVLLKPGPLTREERTIMETHAEIGHRLLSGSQSEVMQLAATIALTHHERYDGSGYPQGLQGEDIPIEGRIVAIADVFDALTADRVYRPAMTVDQALGMLRDGRGTHFDPELLDRFLDDHRGATD